MMKKIQEKVNKWRKQGIPLLWLVEQYAHAEGLSWEDVLHIKAIVSYAQDLVRSPLPKICEGT